MTQRAFLGLFLVLTPTPLFAQTTARTAAPDLPQLLASWHASHGSNWRLVPDAETGFLQMLHGGRTVAARSPASDVEYFDLARAALADTLAMHGVDASTLEPVRTLHLPLGIIGSSDKMTVRFRQVVDGVPVEGGFVNVLFDMQGSLLSIQTVALPHVAGFDVSATVAADDAVARAIEAFRSQTGLLETSIAGPELVVDQWAEGERRGPRLAWKTDVHAEYADSEAQGFMYFVDARTGETYRSEATVHSFDVSGTVTTNATPGLGSDNPGNPPTQQPMRFATVQSGAVSAITDTNGNFTLPGLTAPISVTVRYAGPRCVVINDDGVSYALTTTLTQPTGNTLQMNPAPTEGTTAEANIYRHSLVTRDFIQAINPSDTTGNFVVIGHAMHIPLGQPPPPAPLPTCNANWNGSAVNFYRAGSNCWNFGLSTVVSHEVGHWLNDRYDTNNGSDGMGEGNADIWAMYVHDSPIIGQGVYISGGSVRTGLNTEQFCGNASPQCYGEVHAGGEPWMGAAWKIRNRLNVAHGDTMGDLIADSLFLGWMNSYNQTQIRSIIENQWLTLDDNDGNLSNGTPHYAQIDPGFRDQGWPGMVEVTISNVTTLADTTNSIGPYTVQARIVTSMNGPLVTKQLKYRVNGGGFQTVNMTSLGGDDYSASIPGQAAPAKVEWYVTAANTATSFAVHPLTAPDVPFVFDVGIKHILRSHNFEAGTAEGWTNGAYAGNNEWQRGDPAGKFGNLWSDPGTGFSPNNCWGTDLGNGTGGTYSSNSHTWLRSPITNCTGAVGTHLRFKRWLSVQGSNSDQARILVNGTQIYVNGTSSFDDGGWIVQDFNISSQADNNASVQIEWSVQADNQSTRGGWNIDDVEILWVEAPAPCPTPVNYCVGAPNSTGIGASMGFTGTANIAANDLTLVCTGCPSFTTGLFFYGANAIQAPFGNGFRCVGGSTFRLSIETTDFLGDAVRPLDLGNMPNPILPGETWRFQYWYRNPAAGGAFFNLSDGLAVTFCP